MLEQTLRRLISYPSVSADHKVNRRLLAEVRSLLRGTPAYFKNFTFGGFPALLATSRRTRKPRLLLQAHVDVVGGSPAVFKPHRKGGRLYGRGTFDMKFAAACFIELFKDLGPRLPGYDLGLLLTTDEELGGQFGVKKILAAGVGARFCLLPDGGENWTVQRSAKGVYQVQLECLGLSGHGSRPWTGTNAIVRLTDCLRELSAAFPAEPCGNSRHNHNTITVSRISGGQEINKIPDYAQALCDIRINPKSSVIKVRKIVGAAVKKFPGVTMRELGASEPYRVPVNGPLFQNFTRLIRKATGRPIEYVDSHGSSDARYFLARGIPTVLLRPVGGGHHTEKEWISLPSLEKFYGILRRFVEENGKIG